MGFRINEDAKTETCACSSSILDRGCQDWSSSSILAPSHQIKVMAMIGQMEGYGMLTTFDNRAKEKPCFGLVKAACSR